MTTKFPSRPIDGVIGALADRQHGAVARRQLLARGISADAITTRIHDGRLRRVHRGVYLVGHRAAAPLARLAAAASGGCTRSLTANRRPPGRAHRSSTDCSP